MVLNQAITFCLLFVSLLTNTEATSYLVLDSSNGNCLSTTTANGCATQVTSPAGAFYIALSGSYFALYCSSNNVEYYSFGYTDPNNGLHAPYTLYVNDVGLVYLDDSIGDLIWIQPGSGFSSGQYQAYIRDNANFEVYLASNLATAVWSTNIEYNGQDSTNSAYSQCGLACHSNPCLSNQTCTNSGNSYMCTCPTGYNGTSCQNNYTGCNSNPCLNSGSCTPVLGGLFHCTCPTGYNGTSCQNNYSGCNSNPCLTNEICTPVLGGSFSCTCPTGYTNGTDCGILSGACNSNPCLNGGTCIESNGEFSCNCTSAYYGTSCSQAITNSSNNTTTSIIIGCVVGGVVLIILIVLILVFVSRRKKNQAPKSKSDQEVALTSKDPRLSSVARPPTVAASFDAGPRSHEDGVAPLPARAGTMSAIEKAMNDPKYPYDVFISYRQATDQHAAHVVYLELKNRTIFNRKIEVFFDVMELQTGEDWEQGFLGSLKKAKIFVPVISHAGLEAIRNLVEGKKDNVLYEYEMALAEKESRNLRIIPLLTASVDSGGVQWFKDFNENLYPEIFSVTCKTRTVRETMKMMFKLQGIKLIPQAGDIEDGVQKLIEEIEAKKNRLSSFHD